MRKLLLWFVLFFVVSAIVHALPSDAIEVFTSAGNSVSISTAGKVFRLNIASGVVIYDLSNRVTQVGNTSVTYDRVTNRVIKIGDIPVNYDASNRVIKIGNTVIAYDFANRMFKIGDASITYDVISRVKNITGKIPDNIRFASVPEQP